MIRPWSAVHGLALALAAAGAASAQHDWTIEPVRPGVTASVGVSENSLMSGEPWDTDGVDECPPAGDDDVRCEWLQDHTGGDPAHAANGVLAAVLDGTTAQSAVFLSDQWSDPISSGSIWWVEYDVHFIALDPADMTSLRVTSEYQHAGITQLTLNLTGPAGTVRVRHVFAPTHFWLETPETGSEWRIRLTLRRLTAGEPAMIWVDNIEVTEGAEVLFEDVFPLACPADLDGSGDVGFADLLALLAAWGACAGCPEDLDGDGTVGFADLLAVLSDWGPCV